MLIRSCYPPQYPNLTSKGTAVAISCQKQSLAKVLQQKGGYSNHPADPGCAP
jgi:hypothetical protein